MEQFQQFGLYAALAITLIFLCVVIPRFIYKRVKADNPRDAHHAELMILVSFVITTIGAVLTVLLAY